MTLWLWKVSYHNFLCLISSDSHQEPVVAEDADPGEQVMYTAISGSVSEEASENS